MARVTHANKTDSTTPTGGTTEAQAQDYNQYKDKSNNPGLNDAWSSIVKFDDEYFPPDKTMSGAITYTIDATNAGTGNGRKDTIIGDGNTITFTGFTIKKSSLNVSSNVVTTVSGTEYTIIFLRVGSITEVYISTNSTSGTTQLTAPANFQASSGDTQVLLSWSTVASATGYVLQFHDGDLVWADVPTYDGTSTNYTHTSLTNGTQYFYRVKATASGYTDSAYSQVNATPSAGITQLTAPTLNTLTAANAQITAAFTNNAGGNEDDTLPEYRVTSVGGAWSNATPFPNGATSGIITGLINGTEYDVQLIHRGSGAYSNSDPSATLTATPVIGNTVLFDTFTDTNGTNITAHTPETGNLWVEQAGGAHEIQSNKVIATTTGTILSAQNVDDVHFIIEDFEVVSTTNNCGFYARWQLSGSTANRLSINWTNANTVDIYEVISGSANLLASPALTYTAGTHKLEIIANGTSLEIKIDDASVWSGTTALTSGGAQACVGMNINTDQSVDKVTCYEL